MRSRADFEREARAAKLRDLTDELLLLGFGIDDLASWTETDPAWVELAAGASQRCGRNIGPPSAQTQRQIRHYLSRQRRPRRRAPHRVTG